jgi:hypothetical protein
MVDVRHLSNLKFFDFFNGVRRGGYLTAGRAQVRTTFNQDMAERHGVEATLVFNACGDITTLDALWVELWRFTSAFGWRDVGMPLTYGVTKGSIPSENCGCRRSLSGALIHASLDDVRMSI